VASNSAGNQTSSPATLTVLPVISASCGSSVTDPAITIAESATPAKPALGQPFGDADLGGCLTRISDVASLSMDHPVPTYSTIQAWNADQSKILLVSGHILDAHTFALVGTSPQWTDERWSPVDPNIIYGTLGNKFMKFDIRTRASTALHTFTEY